MSTSAGAAFGWQQAALRASSNGNCIQLLGSRTQNRSIHTLSPPGTGLVLFIGQSKHDRQDGGMRLLGRNYREKIGGGRWKSGERLGGSGTGIIVCNRLAHRRFTTNDKPEI